MTNMTQEELQENFSLLTSWEEKYQYIIELGEALPPFPEDEKTDENKVEGCMSQVWFKAIKTGERFVFSATSDAIIVKGLEAILLNLINHKTKEEIKALDIEGIFKSLGLEAHLSPTRRNGFYAMIERIKLLIEQ